MKFFVISDTHSYYDAMIDGLNNAGFDKNNPAHTLIVCGDAFDRGYQAKELLDYLNSTERKILIKGNHDDMLMELLKRKFPNATDERNGTVDTVYQLGYEEGTEKFSEYCRKASRLYTPLYSQMKDYFETKNYIFTHSWMPLTSERYGFYSFDADWRNAPAENWKDARWHNPYEFAQAGMKPDKTVVFGHWHTSWPRAWYENGQERGPDADFSIYYGDGYIGIDAMTAYSGKVNVLVLEDEFLEE